MKELLDRPIAFHRCFVEITGSVNAALMLSQAWYWSLRTKDDDGWFWKTHGEWTEETGMSRREQDTARKRLRQLGLIDEKLSGVPATVHFRVCHDTVQTRLAETYQQDRRNRANWIGEKRATICTETTTETTENNPVPGERIPSPKEKEGRIKTELVNIVNEIYERILGEPYCTGSGTDPDRSAAVSIYRNICANDKGKFRLFAETVIEKWDDAKCIAWHRSNGSPIPSLRIMAAKMKELKHELFVTGRDNGGG